MNSKSLLSYLFKNDIICDKCREKMPFKMISIKLANINITSIYCYKDEFRANLIQYKEGYDEAIGAIFMYPFQKQFAKKYPDYTIVYMPSSKKKLETRGFNHLEKMFAFSKNEKMDILDKIKEVNQKELSYSQRIKNTANFRLKYLKRINKILLVDDVITTGASILGAYKELEKISNHIEVFVVSYNKSWTS